MNRSLPLVALVPPAVVTVTSTVPVPAGEVAVIEVALLTVNAVALLAPKFTAVAPVKLVPVMATLVPPAVGPLVGEIEVTLGTAALALPLVVSMASMMAAQAAAIRIRAI